MSSLIEEGLISENSKVVLVNDGSKDKTWEIITKIHKENHMYVGINLTRNRGHQNALLAGLMYAKNHADICISMDADLQDDINYYEMESYAYDINRKYDKEKDKSDDFEIGM